MKAALAGEKTVVTLYNQWNAGLQYLQKNVLDQASQYEAIPDLGVITRSYDEQRMVRLRDKYQKHCHDIANNCPKPGPKEEAARYSKIQRSMESGAGNFGPGVSDRGWDWYI